jgi:4-hydroxy-2-oxoheptanedioate aldolase
MIGAMKTNTTKAKLLAGQTVYGTFIRYPDATLVETLAHHDWDFLLFDGEHGTIEPRDCEAMARAAELLEVTPVVRVPANQPHIILRFMDSGVHACQIPWVNSALEADNAVQSVKYGPRGKRGLAGVTRAASHGQRGALTDYVQQANTETMVIVQVETVTAVENLEAMLAVPDIDVFFVGPNDLAHSMGLPGQVQDPRVQTMIESIFAKVLAAGKIPGIQVPNVDAARAWKAKGARYITIQLESLIRPAVEGYLKAVREG